jgi:FkbM family methyltransferase
MVNPFRYVYRWALRKLTLVTLWLKYRMPRDRMIRFSYQGGKYYYRVDSSRPQHLLKSMVKLQRLVDCLPEKPFTVFDVGANCGLFSALLESRFSAVDIHLFEPSDSLQACIRKNVSGRLIINNAAVGDYDGYTNLFVNKDSQQTNSMIKDSATVFTDESRLVSRKVEITTLSTYCRDKQIAGIDVLKIDVQGYELSVLQGAGALLNAVRFILLESSWLDWDSIDAVRLLKDEYGFGSIGVVNDVFGGADLLLSREPIRDPGKFYRVFNFQL